MFPLAEQLLAFAEFEHDNIVEILSTGKAVSKAHGKKTDGRYKKEPVDFNKYYNLHLAGEITISAACSEMNICRSAWYKLAKDLVA